MYFSSRAPHKTFNYPFCSTKSEHHGDLTLTKLAICKAGITLSFNFSLHSSLQDLPYPFEETTMCVTMLVYSQLIVLRPSHILKLTVYFLAEMVSKQIMKADHRVNTLESKIDEKKRPAGVMRISCFLHPLSAILETVIDLIKVSVIMKKKPKTFIQINTHVLLSKLRP